MDDDYAKCPDCHCAIKILVYILFNFTLYTKTKFYLLQVLLLSMRDMNIAKLTSQDLPLFLGIVQDLFPGVETPVVDYGKVRTCSARICSPFGQLTHV
jgi:hypothetical protein